MNSLLHLTIFCIALLLLVPEAGGTEYYLRPAGDDSAPGTSPEKAWKSIDKVNATTFKPGDKILFEGGETFNGSLNFGMVDSGTAENPVTVGSYGTGRAAIRSGSEYGLYAKNTSGFVVKDLIFIGAGAHVDERFSGIYFFTDLGTKKPEHIRIDNVDVSGYRWNGIGIYADKRGHSGFRDVRITNARVHDNGDKGIASGGPQPPGDWGHKGIYVGRCRVYNIRGISGKRGHSGNGIILSSVDGAVIEYCTAYNNGEFSDDPDSGGPIGIWAWDSRNVVIQFCESYNNKTGNQADGGGFDLDGGCVNCIMQYNYSHDNHGAGFGIYQYASAREFKNNVVRYNISENDGIKNRYGGINLWSTNSSGGIRNTKIYNNTVYVSAATRGAAIGDLPYVEGTSYVYDTQIFNNIVVGVAGKKLVDIPYPASRWNFKGNCYWTYDGDIQIRWGEKTFTSLNEWREATGQERLNGLNVGFETDPKLTKPGQGKTLGDPSRLHTLNAYKLKRSSELIDRGLDIKTAFGMDAGSRDFYGTPVPCSGTCDIGAHEFD
jgi:hypothetical protein